ncbi:hypothetical protein MMC06_001109 [Schaereria dolodes]|nr:hypothetical protein [Schaereria dolodes]
MTLKEIAPTPDIPLECPSRVYIKRGLPPFLASTYPHGHISGHQRSPNAQRSFEARKASILRNMTASEIEIAYQDIVAKINAIIEEDRRRNEEVDREVEILSKQREMERKLFWKLVEDSGRKAGKKAEGENTRDTDPLVKEEGEA